MVRVKKKRERKEEREEETEKEKREQRRRILGSSRSVCLSMNNSHLLDRHDEREKRHVPFPSFSLPASLSLPPSLPPHCTIAPYPPVWILPACVLAALMDREPFRLRSCPPLVAQFFRLGCPLLLLVLLLPQPSCALLSFPLSRSSFSAASRNEYEPSEHQD